MGRLNFVCTPPPIQKYLPPPLDLTSEKVGMFVIATPIRRVSSRETLFSQNEYRDFTGSKVITEKPFRKNRLFLEFLLSASQTVQLRSNLRHVGDKANRAIRCVFFLGGGGAVALLVPELGAELYTFFKRQNLLLVT